MKDKKQKAGASGWTFERRLAKAKQMREYNQSKNQTSQTQTERSTSQSRTQTERSTSQSRTQTERSRLPIAEKPRPSVAEHKRKKSNWTKEDTLDACFTPRVRAMIYQSEGEWIKRKSELLKAMGGESFRK